MLVTINSRTLRVTVYFKLLVVGENLAIYGNFKDVETLVDRILASEDAKI